MSTRITFNRGLNKSGRIIRKMIRYIFPPPSQNELFPSDLIVHFAQHKNLTVYYLSIMKRLSREFNFSTKHFHSDKKSFEEAVFTSDNKRILSVNNCSDISFDRFPKYKGSHFIRDPRDLIVSGYYYHLWTKEAWCTAPEGPTIVTWSDISKHPYFIKFIESDSKKFPAMISYQEYLNNLDIERGMILELILRQNTFTEMKKWKPNPNIIEYRYEEIIGNEVDVFRKIFLHYEFHPKLIKRGLQIVDSLSLKNKVKGKKSHTRKGVAGQWKSEFTPLVKEAFKNLYGDLLIQLGYEEDDNWRE